MMIETQAPSVGAEYDSHYNAWLGRQGPRALDLVWRLRHLLWRQRVLLRRYRPDGKAGPRFRLHGRGLHHSPAATRRGCDRV